MACGYIDDGYTLPGYIKESAGIYPAVRFEYRPIPHEERVRLFEGWSTLPAAEQIRRVTEKLSQKIVSWDLKDRQGRAINCKEPGVYRKLVPPLQEKLMDIVCSVVAPDPDPDAAREISSETSHFAESGEKNS